MKIPFNIPYITGKEILYIKKAIENRKLSGDGFFSKKCHELLEHKYGFQKVLTTHSGTAALEMAAMLINIQPEDEIIMPSYTFVSTANAFILRGAKLIFTDSSKENPNIDSGKIEELVSPRTKAIVVVHYGGIACNMDKIIKIAVDNNLFVIEDGAQSIDSYYNDKPLGSIGHLGCFSFHETKNIISGEGGLLTINDPRFNARAEIIREKGTNRSKFYRGEIDKYNWVDIGSSFLPSDIISAFLFAQLENIDYIQEKRKKIWELYYKRLKLLEKMDFIRIQYFPKYATNNAHTFYFVCTEKKDRDNLLNYLKQNGIQAQFHYLGLHNSPYFRQQEKYLKLPECEKYVDNLIRLPLYPDLSEDDVNYCSNHIIKYFNLNT